ncbi:MAG: hypothetical protein ACJASZ_000265 [Yoonia sp.]|jgi:hypothetical protein
MNYRIALFAVIFGHYSVLVSPSASADGLLVWIDWAPTPAYVEEVLDEYATEYKQRTGYFMPNGLNETDFKTHLCTTVIGMTGPLRELDDDDDDGYLERDYSRYPPAAQIETDDLIYLHSKLDANTTAFNKVAMMTPHDRNALLSECK